MAVWTVRVPTKLALCWHETPLSQLTFSLRMIYFILLLWYCLQGQCIHRNNSAAFSTILLLNTVYVNVVNILHCLFLLPQADLCNRQSSSTTIVFFRLIILSGSNILFKALILACAFQNHWKERGDKEWNHIIGNLLNRHYYFCTRKSVAI